MLLLTLADFFLIFQVEVQKIHIHNLVYCHVHIPMASLEVLFNNKFIFKGMKKNKTFLMSLVQLDPLK
jgi:hypothetical protein